MKINWILSLTILLFSIGADTKLTNAVDLAEKLNNYSEQFPTEKVFLHHDRDYYGPGETIWLKSYLVAGSFHQPSPISNNVHVELISPEKELIQHILLYSEEGFSAGNIQLPVEMKSGTYLLRGYTNWMKNFDESYFYEKEVEIIAGLIDEKGEIMPQTNVQFFPEGGELVADVPSRIAFKVDFSEENQFDLIDENGQILAEARVEHNGMGIFALTPKSGTDYFLKTSGGQRFSLPKVQKQGFSIAVNPNLPELVKITLRSNENTNRKDALKAIVHSRGLVSFAVDIDLSKNVAFLNLPKTRMPEGISHITLFDQKDRPLIERLVFVKKDLLIAEVTSDKAGYGTRSEVKTKIKVTNKAGEPVQGNFSLAALDINLVPTALPSKTITSELLLTSDLKGKIEDPTYYFSDAPQAKQHLDLLMMTKGWKRFLWDDILNEDFPEIEYLIEKGVNVEGKIVDKFNGKPIENGQITYFDNSLNPPLIDEVVADEDGNFTINNIVLFNNRPVTFQGANKKGKGQAIVGFEIMDSVKYTAPEQWSTPITYEEENEDLITFADKSKERQLIDNAFDFDTTATRLDDVVVIGERAQISQEESAYGAGDVTFTYDQVNVATKAGRGPLDVLQGRISGVQISGMGIGQSVVIRGGVSGMSAGASPAFYLNDVPTDLQTILYIPATDIERVEVFKGPSAAIFGANGATGVMAFYTYKGGGSTRPTEGMFTKVIANAYQGPIEFYAPSYEEQLPEHVKPDRRVLVHWEPMIETDENGEAQVSFWTTDNETTIQLDLQGISKTGNVIAQLKTIEVSKDN